MTAELDPTKLYSYSDLAPALGVTPKTVASYHRRSRDAGYPPHLFPPPTKVIEDKYPRWRWSKVKKWNDHRPGPGWHAPQREGRDDVFHAGRPAPGETVRRLQPAEQEDVRRAWKDGTSRQQLATQYGVSYATIYRATR